MGNGNETEGLRKLSRLREGMEKAIEDALTKPDVFISFGGLADTIKEYLPYKETIPYVKNYLKNDPGEMCKVSKHNKIFMKNHPVVNKLGIKVRDE